MEINKLHGSAISSYKKVASAAGKAGKSSSLLRPNTDKIEFNLDSSLTAAKANIASCADAEANISRIEQLQQAYCGESCPVSSAQVAEKIING